MQTTYWGRGRPLLPFLGNRRNLQKDLLQIVPWSKLHWYFFLPSNTCSPWERRQIHLAHPWLWSNIAFKIEGNGNNALFVKLSGDIKYYLWILSKKGEPGFLYRNNFCTISELYLKQGQIGLERSVSWSLIPIHGPRGSKGRPTGSQGVKGSLMGSRISTTENS